MDGALWFELLARSGALLLAGYVVVSAMRRSSAAQRHGFLCGLLALLLVLPLLAALLPEIPVMPGTRKAARGAVVTVVELRSRTVESAGRPVVQWLFWIWAAGVGAACLPLAVGVFSVGRMARRARPLRDEIWLSTELRVPVTCGIRRPRILLPVEALHWTPARWQAVLLHERAHIQRGDVAAQVTAHLVAALWWFQPLVWLTRRRLRLESEFACDAAAIGSGFRSSDYAAELLAVARSAGRAGRMGSPALAMVRPSDLEERVRRVLRAPQPRLRPVKTYLLGLLLASAAMAASAVSFRGQQSLNERGGSSMKHVILSAWLTAAGLSAATVSGTVQDATGAAIADAKITIQNPDTAEQAEAMTGADGKFSISGSAAGQYILRIEKAGFTSVFREFDLQADSTMERAFTMPVEGGPGVEDNLIAANEEPQKKVRVGGRVAQSNLVRKVQPSYPAAAKKARVQGAVELEATISKDGVPSELRVIASPGDDLSASALEAVRQWRYRPTLLNGAPVSIITTVLVNYTLSQ